MNVSRITANLAIVLVAIACQAPASEPSARTSDSEVESGSHLIEPPVADMSESEFAEWLIEHYELGAAAELYLMRRGASQIPERTFARYQRRHEGLRVGGEGFTAYLHGGYVTSAFVWLTGPLDASTWPELEAATALEIARAAVARELDAEELDWDEEASRCDPHLEAGPSGEYGLVHSCVVRARASADYAVVIDDATGALRRILPRRLASTWTPTTATGVTTYNGVQGPFAAEEDLDTGTFRLSSPQTWTLYDSDPPAPPNEDITHTSNYFDDPDDADGVSIHWATHRGLAHLASRFNIDPLQSDQTAYVLLSFGAAAMPSNTLAYTDPGGAYVAYGTGNVHVDTVGHELAHVLAWRKELLTIDAYVGEFASLHESFADILGELLEADVNGFADWESVACKLADPQSTSCPAVYQGPYWSTNGDYHLNATVQSWWFHLLAFGHTILGIKGVGVDTAARILYETITVALDLGEGYDKVAYKSEQTIQSMCGPFSLAYTSAHNAWHAAGLTASAITSTPHSNPVDGAIDVHPWPVTLKWMRGFGVGYSETAWQVQISTSNDFVGAQTYQTSQIGTDGVFEVGVLDSVHLEPNKIYFWRVRPLNSDPTLNCWRQAKSFETSNPVPVPQSPNPTGDWDLDTQGYTGTWHPWQLSFIASNVGSPELQIEVAYSPEELNGNAVDPVFPIKTFPNDANDDIEVELTVPQKARALYWRVRGKHGASVGQWSSWLGFAPRLVEAVGIAPTASGTDPWPVTFEWKYLKGAEHTLRVESPTAETPLSLTIPQLVGATHEKNLSGELYFDQIEWWLDKPLGPYWGSALEPEAMREHGVGSAPLYFSTNGKLTEIDGFSPDFAPDWPSCIWGNAENLTWPDAHPQAAKYELRVWEAFCPLNSTCTKAQLAAGTIIPDDPASPVTAFQLIPLTPTSANDHVGYIWEVRAFTADDVPGWFAERGEFFVRPIKPQMLGPANGVSFEAPQNGTVTFSWDSTHAHGGGFVLTVYEGSDCSTVDYSTVIQGFSNGTTATELTSSDWMAGNFTESSSSVVQSWSVRPFSYIPCGSVGGDCRKFTVTPPPPEAPPAGTPPIPVVFGGTYNGNLDYVIMRWTSVPATDFRTELYQAIPDGNGGFTLGQALEQWPQWPLIDAATLSVEKSRINNLLCDHNDSACNQINSNEWFLLMDGSINLVPRTEQDHYYYRVRACNGEDCSDWSSFSLWSSTIVGPPWYW